MRSTPAVWMAPSTPAVWMVPSTLDVWMVPSTPWCRRWRSARLRPGGQLLVLEHVLGTGLTGLAQRAAGPVGAALGAGCRVDMDLGPALRRAGFDLTDAARFTAWLGSGVPTPYLAGVARLRPPAQSTLPQEPTMTRSPA
jgi:hypothetical protein